MTTQLKTSTVVRWFHALNIHKQSSSDKYFSRMLECFWESQLQSKLWLIDMLEQHGLMHYTDFHVLVFGGWYGILGQMLCDEGSKLVYSIDIDPECEVIGPAFAPDVRFRTADMTINTAAMYPVACINTSSEHITQPEYDRWWNTLSIGSLVIVQGNNFFDNPEHVRCHATLREFVDTSNMQHVVYAGELPCDHFTRFMIIGFR